MRFHSPDNMSPFGEGGLNAYVYCEGDPVNFVDPEGHSFFSALRNGLRRFGRLIRPSGGVTTAEPSSSNLVPRPTASRGSTSRALSASGAKTPARTTSSPVDMIEAVTPPVTPSPSRSGSFPVDDALVSFRSSTSRARRGGIVGDTPGIDIVRARFGVSSVENPERPPPNNLLDFAPPAYDEATLPTYDQALKTMRRIRRGNE